MKETQAPVETAAPVEKPRPFSWLRKAAFGSKAVATYISYVLFVVFIGMVYIWNSHIAEKQVKEEARLRKEIADAKAEYKTMHARLSSGTRRQVIFSKVDSLGLRSTNTNVFKLTKTP
ncbi:MAG TPA: FtsL-like putative cell division protein [Bacteroidia bacterium]|nr:FtsL-like putative cell division protein [Bacteroidia bacterium]